MNALSQDSTNKQLRLILRVISCSFQNITMKIENKIAQIYYFKSLDCEHREPQNSHFNDFAHSWTAVTCSFTLLFETKEA